MKKEMRIEKRKTSLLTRFVFFIVLLIFLGEGLVLSGILELDASAVERHAPWAYESFLHFIGEHPSDPVCVLAVVEEEKKSSTKKENATGLSDGLIPVLMKESPRRKKIEESIPKPETSSSSNTSNTAISSTNAIQKIAPTPSKNEEPVG